MLFQGFPHPLVLTPTPPQPLMYLASSTRYALSKLALMNLAIGFDCVESVGPSLTTLYKREILEIEE